MRSLFVRIFVVYVLVNVAALGVVSWAYSAELERRREERTALVGDSLRLHGTEALLLLRAGDRHGASAALARFERRSEADALVLAPEHSVGDALPSGLQAIAAAAGGELVHHEHGAAHWIALAPRGEGLDDVVLAARLDAPHERHEALPVGPATFRLGVAMIIAALVSLGLAHLLSVPVRALRVATRRIAAGDLEHRVAPQISQIADEETRALAEDFDRMTERVRDLLASRERLLRDVSHELRSPLARISVALAIAERRAGGEGHPELDRIEKEVARLDELVGLILTMARLEQGAPALEAIHLDALLEQVREDADFEAQGTGRSVVLTASAPAVVRGTAETLRQAIENVVRNAVRFTPEGSAVDLSLRLEGDIWARIDVRDRGPGVPDDALEAIFHPFTRLDASRDHSSVGTGVGLAITERALRLHGGEVRATNAPGGGLLVTLRLPIDPR